MLRASRRDGACTAGPGRALLTPAARDADFERLLRAASQRVGSLRQQETRARLELLLLCAYVVLQHRSRSASLACDEAAQRTCVDALRKKLHTHGALACGADGSKLCYLWKEVRLAVYVCLTASLDKPRALFLCCAPDWRLGADSTEVAALLGR